MAKSLLEALPGIVAAGKREAEQILEGIEGRNRVSLQTRELVIPRRTTQQTGMLRDGVNGDFDPGTANRLIYGDNLLAMAALLAGDDETPSMRGKIDLIYIDPPFDSKADYRTTVTLPGTTIEARPTVIEQFAYSDTWSDGTASYLGMISPRLVLMRELLTDTGSIYVHLDWHVGHYVKLILDDIFGRELFLNEVIWLYGLGGSSSRYWPRKHDALMWYSKSLDRHYFQADMIPATSQRMKGELKKAPDYWDIPNINNQAHERLDFGTQKPEALLHRIVESSCPAEGVVADFFVGSGTTAAVAEKLGRKWIATDLGKPATMITRKRLIDQDAKPFLYQAIGDYQIELVRSTLGRRYRVGDLARTVLTAFGALPLSADANPMGNLGRITGGQTSTLIYADSPNRLTTASTLRRAIQLRDSTMGGFNKVTVLGWNFSAGIAQDVAALNDDRLEVLVIPPDLLDRLKKKGGKAADLAGKLRFSSLQYLQLGPCTVTRQGSKDVLSVALANYVVLSPEAINLDDKNRAQLQAVINKEPLALIEY